MVEAQGEAFLIRKETFIRKNNADVMDIYEFEKKVTPFFIYLFVTASWQGNLWRGHKS